MNRRAILEWLSRALATAIAGLVGVPGVRFFARSEQTTLADEAAFQRLKRLQDLPVGRPVLVPVMGCKRDGWMRSEQEVLGRVWLVRDDADDVPVKVFSSVCPHMGCQVQAQRSAAGFTCPCHRARFGRDGRRLIDPQAKEGSASPRDLDRLECRIETDAKTGEAWVEVKFQKFETGLEQQVVRA
jgi:menaquinol-cytochrome c reductase iron-sulfur subunit